MINSQIPRLKLRASSQIAGCYNRQPLTPTSGYLVDKRSPPKFDPSFYGPRYWLTWFGLGFFHLLAVLPMSITLRFGRVLGDLFFYVARSRRHIARVNIAQCFPQLSPKEQEQLVRKVMHSTGKAVVETAV